MAGSDVLLEESTMNPDKRGCVQRLHSGVMGVSGVTGIVEHRTSVKSFLTVS